MQKYIRVTMYLYVFLHMPKYTDNYLKKHTSSCKLLPQEMGKRMGKKLKET